ncbi:hypothetical protein MYMA111404_00080 [Mycoplasma marinum]|uniref:Uncharacterized protein n=1 Tax=Mycoplasma marinum TaxID=1937190 RepID=A0A4R0XVD7_9MOLU|nr:hypothetical protein [Mycoplasma marinum]TCG11702.1 hypothetical protein C4B24_00925 [Mycoplasma marinum]
MIFKRISIILKKIFTKFSFVSIVVLLSLFSLILQGPNYSKILHPDINYSKTSSMSKLVNKDFIDGNQNNTPFKYKEIPQNINNINSESDLVQNHNRNLQTISLNNLGKISEIYFEGINNNSSKYLNISEISLLNAKNENISYVVKKQGGSIDNNKITKETNSWKNLNNVLRDGKTGKINFENNLNDKTSIIFSKNSDVYQDLGLKLYNPEYISSIALYSSSLKDLNFSIRVINDQGQEWVSKKPQFKENSIVSNMLTIGTIDNQPTEWFLTSKTSNKYWFKEWNYSKAELQKGYTTIFYKGQWNNILNGIETFKENKISVGSANGSYDGIYNILVLSDNINIKDLNNKPSTFFNELLSNNFIRKIGEVKLKEDTFAFSKKEPNYKMVNFIFPINSPFEGIKNQNIAYLNYEKLFENGVNIINQIDYQNIIFEYKYQVEVDGIASWNNHKINNDWIQFNPYDYFNKKIKKISINLNNISSNNDVNFALRVRTKNGYWLNKINNTQQQNIYSDYNFRKKIMKFSFNKGDIGLSTTKAESHTSLEFMGDVEYIKLTIPSWKYAKGKALSEFKITDKNNKNVDYSVVSSVYSGNRWRANKQDLKDIHEILTDGIWDMKLSMDKMNNDKDPDNDIVTYDKYWRAPHGAFASKKSDNRFLSTGYWYRNGIIPSLLIKLNSPTVIKNISWMTWGQEKTNPKFKFINYKGIEFTSKTSNFTTSHDGLGDADKITYRWPPNGGTYKDFKYKDQWIYLGKDKANFWTTSLNNSQSNIINAKTLKELGEIYNGNINLPIFANNRWNKNALGSIVFIDENDKEIPWEINQNGVHEFNRENSNYDNNYLETILGDDGLNDRGLSSLGLHNTPTKYGSNNSFDAARVEGFIQFKFKFKDGKPHFIKFIKIKTGPNYYEYNNNFAKQNGKFIGEFILNGKNQFYSLEKFNPSKTGAIKKEAEKRIAFNLGENYSSDWRRYEYKNANFILNQQTFSWKTHSGEYKLQIYDELNKVWLPSSNLKFSEIRDTKNIKFRVIRSDNGIFENGKYSIPINLDMSIFNNGVGDNISADNIYLPINRVKILGINKHGILKLPDIKYSDKLTIRYQVVKKDGKKYFFISEPKNLENGDKIFVIFNTKSPIDNIVKTNINNQLIDYGNSFSIPMNVVSGLVDTKDLSLLKQIPNISNYINNYSTWNINFLGTDFLAKPSNDFMSTLKMIDNTSSNIEIIISVNVNNKITFYNLEEFQKINSISNKSIITIYAKGIGYQTISYGQNTKVEKLPLLSFTVSDVVQIGKSTPIGIYANQIKNKIQKAISEKTQFDSQLGKNFYSFDKTDLIKLQSQYNFKISLTLKSFNNSNEKEVIFGNLSNMPDKLYVGSFAIFKIDPENGFAFGNINDYYKQAQHEFFSKELIYNKDNNKDKLVSINIDSKTINVIPRIEWFANEFGIVNIDNNNLQNIIKQGYDLKIMIAGNIYEIIDGKLSYQNNEIGSFEIENGQKYEILIKPNKQHYWNTSENGFSIPFNLSKSGVVSGVINKNNIENITPITNISLIGYNGKIVFANGKIIDNLPILKNANIKIAHIEKNYNFDGNIDSLKPYSLKNKTGLIDYTNLTSNYFDFKEGDYLVIKILEKSKNKLFSNFSNKYIRYFKIDTLPTKVNIPILPEVEHAFIEDSNNLKHEIFGTKINWRELTKMGEQITIEVERKNKKIKSLKVNSSNSSNFKIYDLIPNDVVKVKITRNNLIWWNDDIFDSGPKSVSKTYVAPKITPKIYISNIDAGTKIKFNSSLFGIENNGNLKIKNIYVDSSLLPRNFDFKTSHQPWAMRLNIYDQNNKKLTFFNLKTKFKSNNELNDILVKNLKIINGYYYSIDLVSLFGVNFGNSTSPVDFVNIRSKTPITTLYTDFFDSNNIIRPIIPIVEGISGIHTIIDNVFQIFENKKALLGPNGIRIIVEHKGGFIETLDFNNRILQTPISNGEKVKFIIDPDHNKYIIDPSTMLLDSNGILVTNPNDVYSKSIIVNDLPNGISQNIYNKYITQKELISKVIFKDKVLLKETSELDSMISNLKNDKLIMTIFIKNTFTGKVFKYSVGELKKGVLFSRNPLDINYLNIGDTIQIVLTPKDENNYKLYDDSDPLNILFPNKIIINKEAISKFPTIYSDTDFGNLEVSNKFNVLKHYELKNTLQNQTDEFINLIRKGFISTSFNFIDDKGNILDNMKLSYVADANKKGFYLTKENGVWILNYNFGDISILDAQKISKIEQEVISNTKNVEFIVEDDKLINSINSNKITRDIDFNFALKKINPPSIWNASGSDVIVSSQSFKGSISADFKNAEKYFPLSPQKDFYYSINIYDSDNKLIRSIDDIFGWKKSSIQTINWKLLRDEINGLSKYYNVVIYASIWEENNKNGEKIFDLSNVNNSKKPKYFQNTTKQLFIENISLENIRETINFPNWILKTLVSSSIRGVDKNIDLSSISSLKNLPKNLLVSISIVDSQGHVILKKEKENGAKAFEWLENNSFNIENGQNIIFNFITNVPNNIIRDENNAIYEKGLNTSFKIKNISKSISAKELSSRDFSYKKSKNTFFILFNINNILGSDWKRDESNLLFTITFYDSNNILESGTNLTYDEFINLLKKVGKTGKFNIGDKIKLKINTKSGFVFNINNQNKNYVNELSRDYIFTASNINKTEIKLNKIDKLILSKTPILNSKIPFSISGIDCILLPHTVDYYNKLGIDVHVYIDGKEYVNPATKLIVKNNQRITISLLLRDTQNKIILLPNGTLTQNITTSFVISGMHEIVGIQVPNKIQIEGKTNGTASIVMNWLHDINKIDVTYFVKRQGANSWSNQKYLPKNLSNGDVVYLKIRAKNGYIISFMDSSSHREFTNEISTNEIKASNLLNKIDGIIFSDRVILKIDKNGLIFDPEIVKNDKFKEEIKLTYADGSIKLILIYLTKINS